MVSPHTSYPNLDPPARGPNTTEPSPSPTDGMTRAAATLLFCALFLRGVEDADAAAARARCVGRLCVFQHRVNFDAATRFCTDRGAGLLEHRPGDDVGGLRGLLVAASGRYWLRDTRGTDPGSCTAVSVAKGQDVAVVSEPCSEPLDGFVSQHGSSDMCGPVRARAGQRVAYVLFEDFEITDAETLPPGTVATVEEVGAKYPASRHICFSHAWSAAPWACEVLRGGCERGCDQDAKACACPAGSTVHANNVSCVADPCAECAQGCQPQEGGHACTCSSGYRLDGDGKGCVDVDECREGRDVCTGEGEECVNVRGGYECRCGWDFVEEDGACVNISVCLYCEHMMCPYMDGAYRCACREGFAVSRADPTRCVFNCTQRECPARCHPDPDMEERDMQQCFCPDGYVTDIRDKTATCVDIDECAHQSLCDHVCDNLFGGYACRCHDGFRMQGDGRCVEEEEEEEEGGEEAGGGGSGASTVRATPAAGQPASVPSYMKTGSVLGMSAFALVLVALLACVARCLLRRCSSFQLHSLKHADLDMFYLQQVTTDTYKRLSFDKPPKHEPRTQSAQQETRAADT